MAKMKIKFYYLALLRTEDKEFPYSIHGLWPQEGVHTWHACPKNHTFDPERLRVLLPQLHEHWHSFCGEDEDFWKKEWEKHGSCTGLTEVEYFQKTLECFKKVQSKGKEWVQQRSTKIPFDLRFEIVYELDFVEM